MNDRLTPQERVTDHFLIRWLERIEGIDMRPIKEEMARQGLECLYDSQLIEFIEEHDAFDFTRLIAKLADIIDAPARAGVATIRFGDHLIRLVNGYAVSIIPSRNQHRSRNHWPKQHRRPEERRAKRREYEDQWS